MSCWGAFLVLWGPRRQFWARTQKETAIEAYSITMLQELSLASLSENIRTAYKCLNSHTSPLECVLSSQQLFVRLRRLQPPRWGWYVESRTSCIITNRLTFEYVVAVMSMVSAVQCLVFGKGLKILEFRFHIGWQPPLQSEPNWLNNQSFLRHCWVHETMSNFYHFNSFDFRKRTPQLTRPWKLL